MRDILRLMRRDLRQATSNVMATIVVFGLVIIPSLFTWFNVIASWDPFSNTGNLKVAVANTDQGYQSDLVPVRINVGEQVLSALRANDDLDWVITSEDEAIDGTKSGEYYAAIVLPPAFSEDMLTFYADGATVADIEYYTNEKKNALAPTITGQGADGVSSKISQVFSKTLGDVALTLVSSISDFLTEPETRAVISQLEARVSTVASQLRSGQTTAQTFSALIESSVPLVQSAQHLVEGGGTTGAEDGSLDSVEALRSVLATATESLSAALSSTIAGYEAVAASIDDLFAEGNQVTSSQVDVLDTLAARVQQQIDQYVTLRDRLQNEIGPSLPSSAQGALDVVLSRLADAISQQELVRDTLQRISSDLSANNSAAQTDHQEVIDLINSAKNALASAADAYSEQLEPQLSALSQTLTTISGDVAGIVDELRGASTTLSTASDGVLVALQKAQQGTQKVAQGLDKAATTFEEISEQLATAADSGDLSALKDIIGANPGALAQSLAEPVRVDRIAVFPVVSFGAGMAPLYTVLSLWVGALLMTVAIRAGVGKDALPGHRELTPTQKYLGRYGIFALIGMAQSLLVTLGLVLFIEVQPAHPFLLIFAGMVISLVFTLIIYTAVVAFGNAGKALAVLLLVIQISGSGGAYPLQLLPHWFQSISPFLPATHAINALRSAIAGIYQGDYWISLGWLLLFVIPTLLLGLVLRRPLIKFNHNLVVAVESTKLI